jgi:hypothetical protein
LDETPEKAVSRGRYNPFIAKRLTIWAIRDGENRSNYGNRCPWGSER